MDFSDIVANMKKKRSILFDWNSLCLTSLIDSFRDKSKEKVLDFILPLVKDEITNLNSIKPNMLFEKTYNEALAYLMHELKLLVVKKDILAIHSLAKEENDKIFKAKYHAVAQGLSTIHVKEHAMGFIFYYLTALVLEYGLDEEKLEIKILEFEFLLNVK